MPGAERSVPSAARLLARGEVSAIKSCRRMSKPIATVLAAAALCLASACETAPKTAEGKATLEMEAQGAVGAFKITDPTMKVFFEGCYAYAVFPRIGAGAVGLGGAYGKGVVYEKGKVTGYCDMSQGSIGFQLGGQGYSEVIFFQTEKAYTGFKAGKFAFAGQASAVAAAAGASTDVAYESGVAVFTMTTGGLMFQASIGGQNFSYEPKT